MSRPRLLVTGAGGFCGEHACRHFASLGWQVTAAVRRLPAAGAAERAWLGGVDAVLACDLSSRNETEALARSAAPDCVLHLAGANAVGVSWSDPAAVLQSNVMGTVHLLEGIRSLGKPCRVLVAGSMLRFPLASAGDAPKPQHPYSLSKTMQVLVAQSWASLFGMDVIVAEPSNLIGPGRSGGLCGLLARYAAAAERAAERGTEAPAPFRFSSRSEQRDLLDVRDAIAAYELLFRAGKSGSVYSAASGVMRTLEEIADTFGALALRPLRWAYGDSAAASPAPADIGALTALGWSPRYTLRQSLQDALEAARLQA
ncbi:NAD-dependent epimerase/dehydratase family protein [Paenibacillus sacheonensis]|uniref:NAD-dependent epimerase/dehydratase family protein n=1 Tax=Paenibacillus sacheonensis TaxID=742054 RepID=A0A7X5C0M6_9BACL|nr:NAD(P)-dependent oxidoreductase [Paenibacillus sacheonensis]MBM7569274.1 GDP-4-dehydro-6-deoxy-D-mannose reductase [Paenibacillus sacheonensis]NBC71716.1 NAD-dependent epimerase/dehydratase family protein [Paenibacillus sacheonensis]